MENKVVIGGETYKLRFYINGWEESRSYFKDVGGFTDDSMEQMSSGETIKKNGNTFSIHYEDCDGHVYTVNEIRGMM